MKKGTEQWTAEQYRNHYKNKKQPTGKKKSSNDAVREMMLLLDIEHIKYETEYRFHVERKWRFDIAIPEKKLAIEYEGIFGGKSRHTTVTGYTGDTEKYNEAAKLGWRVFRYTKLSYLKVIQDMKELEMLETELVIVTFQ